jgi:purine-nucleoside phosphorylase
VAVFRGRFHRYEGHDWSVVTLMTRMTIQWGVSKLFLTNAAGGLDRGFTVGDLMVITGYRDFISPKWAETGLIPALMQEPVDARNELTSLILKTGEELQKQDSSFRPLQSGTYSGFTGPSYETHAEIEMARRLKSSAVGMSTVPELQTAAGSTTQAAAISVITNVWNDKPMGGHLEVLEAAHQASLRLDKLFQAVLAKI